MGTPGAKGPGRGRAAALCLTGSLRAALLDPQRLFVAPLQSVVLRRLRGAGYSVDVFAVVGSHECAETSAALRDLRLRELLCVDEAARTPAEARWLRSGPRTGWRREAFLGQLRKVRACADLAAGGDYQLLARGRLDALWHRFPEDVASLEAPGVVWLPWRATEGLTQYVNDCFAVGRPEEMAPYLQVYDALLNPRLWPVHRAFEDTPDGLDTEELWEVSLLASNVLARQHRGICFNLLSKDPHATRAGGHAEGEDNCQTLPLDVHPHGYFSGAEWRRAPLKFLPGHFEHNALLTARLLHLLLAEWARLGRPAKVLDFGCGRATMLERWLQSYPASLAGVDMLPGLREVLGDDLLRLDLAQPAFPAPRGRPRGCRAEPPPGAGGAAEVQPELLRRCCLDRACRGISPALGEMGMGPEWVPRADDVQLRPRNLSAPGVLPWGDGRADWVLAVDVVASVPPARRGIFFENVARFAAEGAVFVGDRGGEPSVSTPRHPLESLGFLRDRLAERWLAPFAAQVRRGARVRVLRRRGRGALAGPQPCDLRLLREWSVGRCVFGLSYGCVDGAHVWVSDGCDGWFRRGGAPEAACLSDAGPGARRSRWSYEPEQWQYVECFLPESAEAPLSHPSAALSSSSSSSSSPSPALPPGPRGRTCSPPAGAETCGPWRTRRLHLSRDPSSGALVSEAIPTAEAPLVPLRLFCDAHVQLTEEEAGASWAAGANVRAGECLAFNAWPAHGRPVRVVVRELDRDGQGAEAAREGGHPRARPGAAAVWAEAVARRLVDAEEGLAAVYDRNDPGSAWGNGSRIWRAVAWGPDPGDHGPEASRTPGAAAAALGRLDAFAVLLQTVRLLAEVLVSAPALPGFGRAPAGIMEAAAAALHSLRRAAPEWGMLGERLLRSAGLDGLSGAANTSLDQDGAGWSGGDEAVYVERGDDGADGAPWRLRFANTPLGRYLYHRATFAE